MSISQIENPKPGQDILTDPPVEAGSDRQKKEEETFPDRRFHFDIGIPSNSFTLVTFKLGKDESRTQYSTVSEIHTR